MYEVTRRGLGDLLRNSRSAYPKEASGVLIGAERGHVTRLTMIETPSEENTHLSFIIRDQALRRIAQSLSKSSRICGCFHSHVLGPARPSKRDCASHKASGDLWLIHSLRFQDLKLFIWDGVKFNRTRFRVVPGR